MNSGSAWLRGLHSRSAQRDRRRGSSDRGSITQQRRRRRRRKRRRRRRRWWHASTDRSCERLAFVGVLPIYSGPQFASIIPFVYRDRLSHTGRIFNDNRSDEATNSRLCLRHALFTHVPSAWPSGRTQSARYIRKCIERAHVLF